MSRKGQFFTMRITCHISTILMLVLVIFILQLPGSHSNSPLHWEEMHMVGNEVLSRTDSGAQQRNRTLMNVYQHSRTRAQFASDILRGQPVYVSLTTIHSRIFGITTTIESLIGGTVLPDHIYVFVSKDPHLLDLGVTEEYIRRESKGALERLLLIYPYLSVVFTDNIGPHRKLLPLLSKKWQEDCAIVTVDDHEVYRKTALAGLVAYYEASHRTAIVTLRARRIGLCSDTPPWRMAPYTNKKRKGQWPEASPGLREMLLLPTGTGGVLYRPRFFHSVIFDRNLVNITRTGDDLMFRLAAMAMNTPVVTACAEVDAVGRACPAVVAVHDPNPAAPTYHHSNPQPQSPSQSLHHPSEYTFGRNYPVDWMQGLLPSPGVKERGELPPSLPTSPITANKLLPNNSKTRVSTLQQKHRNYNLRRTRNRRLVVDNSSSSQIASSQPRLQTRAEWHKDPRRKESLATKFNTAGGNNVMWDLSVQYLLQLRVVDVDGWLQALAPLERQHCLLMTYGNAASPNKGAGVGVGGAGARGRGSNAMWSSSALVVTLQNWYDAQCGLCLCDSN